MTTAIDWSQKPRPWCFIGPLFKAEVEAICLDRKPPRRPEKLPDLDGVKFQARLIRAKLTQKELARRVGCSDSTIWGLCNGHGSASPAMWANIDRVLAEAGA